MSKVRLLGGILVCLALAQCIVDENKESSSYNNLFETLKLLRNHRLKQFLARYNLISLFIVLINNFYMCKLILTL